MVDYPRPFSVVSCGLSESEGEPAPEPEQESELVPKKGGKKSEYENAKSLPSWQLVLEFDDCFLLPLLPLALALPLPPLPLHQQSARLNPPPSPNLPPQQPPLPGCEAGVCRRVLPWACGE